MIMSRIALILSPVLALALVAYQVIGPVIASHKYTGDSTWHFLPTLAAMILLLILLIVMLVVSIIRRRVPEAASLMLVSLLLLGSLLSLMKIQAAVEYASLSLFKSTFDQCEQSAHDYGVGGRFKVCTTLEEGDIYTGIAFDVRGELALPHSQRSAEFKSYVHAINAGNVAMFDQCFSKGERISGHFYRWFVNCDMRPK